MKKYFIEALKAMDLTPRQVKSCADLYTACFESVQPLYEMKSIMRPGDMPSKDTRMGKSDKNVELARYKAQHPVKVRFHRTHSDNVDSILNNGITIQNKNYGRNTGDTNEYDNVVWTALNPYRIPVLRDFNKKKPRLIRKGRDFGNSDNFNDEYEIPYNPPAQHRDKIDTLKITFDKDKYNKMDRRKLPSGRRSASSMFKVNEGEPSVSREGEYQIDVFGEDIGKENLSLMQKEDEHVLEEISQFIPWVVWKNNTSYSTTYSEAQHFLPKYLVNTIDSLIRSLNHQYMCFNEVPIDKFKWVMDETANCIANQSCRISSEKYDAAKNDGSLHTPKELIAAAYIPPKTNRPWVQKGSTKFKGQEGHISRAIKDTRDVNNKYKDDILRHLLDVNAMTNRYQVPDLLTVINNINAFLELDAEKLFDLIPEKIDETYVELSNRVGLNYKAMMRNTEDNNKRYIKAVKDCYINAKNSDLSDKWDKAYNEMTQGLFAGWTNVTDEKRNTIKKLLDKKYTFKWAFCTALAKAKTFTKDDLRAILSDV